MGNPERPIRDHRATPGFDLQGEPKVPRRIERRYTVPDDLSGPLLGKPGKEPSVAGPKEPPATVRLPGGRAHKPLTVPRRNPRYGEDAGKGFDQTVPAERPAGKFPGGEGAYVRKGPSRTPAAPGASGRSWDERPRIVSPRALPGGKDTTGGERVWGNPVGPKDTWTVGRRPSGGRPTTIYDRRHDRTIDAVHWVDGRERVVWRRDDEDRHGRRSRHGDTIRVHNTTIVNYYDAPSAFYPTYYYAEPPVPFTIYQDRFFFDLGLGVDVGLAGYHGYYYAPFLPGHRYRNVYTLETSPAYAFRAYIANPYVFGAYYAYPWYTSFYYNTYPDWQTACAYAPGFSYGFSYGLGGGDYMSRFSFGYGSGVRWGTTPFLYSWYPSGGYQRLVVSADLDRDYGRYVASGVYYENN